MTDLTERQPDLVRVETPWGGFAAVETAGVVRLRNIRYARADRFAPPQPVDPDPGESAELQFTTIACPQPPSASAEVLGAPLTGARFDEDCLRLTITRPAEIDDPLPVLVCVHGGAYVSNAGDLPGFDPSTLVREHRIIVVSVTYRLGLLGFIGDDARQRHSANLGLLDVIEALRWVRDHIAGFGGDPDAVTVSGHSSGGDAIAHVLVAEGTEGLIRRAIIQSAPFGIRRRRDAMHAKMREAIGELRSDASYDDLFAAQARAKRAGSTFGLRSGMSFCTEYGHAPLPAEAEIDAIWRRRAPGLEVLVTWTTDETMFYLNQMPQVQAVFRTPVIGPIARRLAVAASSNAVYARGGRRFGRLLARSGATVYEGVFSGRPVGGKLGASHAMETPLLFPNEAVWARAALVAPHGARSLITAGVGMRAAFAGFVRTGRVASRVELGPGWLGGMRTRRR